MEFKFWMKSVDDLVLNKIGVDTRDLPDMDYHNMWSLGMEPEEALVEVFEDIGFPEEEEDDD